MTSKHTELPWVVESNPTIPEGKQVAAFEASGEMAGNRHLQVIIRSHNLDADAKLIVKSVNYHHRLREALDELARRVLSVVHPYPSEDTEQYREETDLVEQARDLLAELDNMEKTK